MIKTTLTALFLLLSVALFAQSKHTYQIKGKVVDKQTRVGVPFSTVLITGSNRGAITDSLGNFSIDNVAPAMYQLTVSSLGYKETRTSVFQITSFNYSTTIEVEQSNYEVGDVTIKKPQINKTVESPVSLNVVSIKEIEKSPGANRDISRVVSSLPGVGGSAGGGYRNDLLVRGGGPSENRYFLDGIEIPNINHFSTQGASGGPVGIIDADMIREVEFYSGAFPANRGNALSSVMNFKLKDGNSEKQVFKATVGASEVAFSANGHIGEKTNYLVSVRRSYLQFLFKIIGLPLLPNFTDVQFKVKHKFNSKNELTILGLGAYDDMKLNMDVDSTDDKNKYLVGYLPIIKQKSYTLGAVYRHIGIKNTQSLIVSNSFMNNRNDKFRDNDESDPSNRTLKYSSDEIEYHIKAENNTNLGRFKLGVGVGYDYTIYKNSTYQKIFTTSAREINYSTDLSFSRYSAFASLRYESVNRRLTGALGVRADANDMCREMKNPLNQLSPRISASYMVFDGFFINSSLGRYFQLPAYTTLGYDDMINLQNDAKYTLSDQAVLGFEYNISKYSRLTAEGFYKRYDNSPISALDNIPLSSKGVDYGVTGAELVNFNGLGRAYGFELMYRLSGLKNIYGTVTYTYFKSEFKAPSGKSYLPSSWDNNHLLTLMGGYSFGKGWDVGLKFRFAGAAPYTPYDILTSSMIDSWNASARPVFDYSRYNSGRLDTFKQLDLRVDKVFYFKGVMLGFYIDIQNILNGKYRNNDILISTGQVDPNDPARYIMKSIKNTEGTILPSIGITIEF